MPLDKDIQEAQKQLQTYKDAIAKERAELTSLRSEKSHEAKKKLEDYESSIPALEVKFNNRKSEIEELDKVIAKKQAEYQAKDEDLAVKYKVIEDTLRKEYDAKLADISKKDFELNQTHQELKADSKRLSDDMDARLRVIESTRQDLTVREQGLATAKKDFNDQQALFHKETQGLKMNLAILTKKTEELNKLAFEKNREADDRLHDLSEREIKAQEILAREFGLDSIKEGLEEMRIAQDAKQAELNQLSSKNNAEKIRLSIKNDELNKRERELKQREEDVKLLEAKNG